MLGENVVESEGILWPLWLALAGAVSLVILLLLFLVTLEGYSLHRQGQISETVRSISKVESGNATVRTGCRETKESD